MSQKNILVMAGGTGGHVFPALAVANELMARGHNVQWLGTAKGIESHIIPAANIPLHIIPIEGVRGRGMAGLLKAPWLILKAMLAAKKIIKAQSIDAVIGFGGFASGPGGLAAWLSRKPLVIHEQNAIAGTTNKLSSRFATKVLAAFPRAFEKANGSAELVRRVQLVGNPVRQEIIELPDAVKRISGHRDDCLRILVLGGSLGALAINRLMPSVAALLQQKNLPVEIMHQAGKQHVEITQQAYISAGVSFSVNVVPFIADMASSYAWADIVICRAGALTVSELMAAGCGALLIPLPNAIDDHQMANGNILVNAGAGQVYRQKELTALILANDIEKLFFVDANRVNQAQLIAMGEAARALSIPQSAQLVADACEEVTRG